jgi:molybdopterin-guanine dinucleotide biosynthesis protein A
VPQLIGVVLAGGRGSRLGRPKGEIVVDGVSLVDRAARALRPVCGSVLISVGAEGIGFGTGYDVVVDADPPGRGPLAGIAAAFESTGQADLVVLACDYPRVETPLLQTLITAGRPDDDLVIVTDLQGRDHPLVGLWRRSTETEVKAALADRIHKVRALLSQFEVRRLGPDELPRFDLDDALLNLNTPEDLERIPEP